MDLSKIRKNLIKLFKLKLNENFEGNHKINLKLKNKIKILKCNN